MKHIILAAAMLALLLSACGKAQTAASQSSSAVRTAPSATSAVESASTLQSFDPVGEYTDDMGSDLIITRKSGEDYTVDYSIYKLTYMENAAGAYDADTGVLHFAGTDDNGNHLAADVTCNGGTLTVTLTQSAYESCPAGTAFTFALKLSE